MIPDAGNFANIHGSCVAVAGRGLLILGPSGAGKSALALQIMALGGQLVADDRVELTRQGDEVIARCPVALRGLIEAHAAETGSVHAARILADWHSERANFLQVCPKEMLVHLPHPLSEDAQKIPAE